MHRKKTSYEGWKLKTQADLKIKTKLQLYN